MVRDQGAKVILAVASIVGVENETQLTEADVEKLIDQVADPVGTFYRFTLPTALISRKVKETVPQKKEAAAAGKK